MGSTNTIRTSLAGLLAVAAVALPALALPSLALGGCGGDSTPEPDGAVCTPGAEGCACIDGTTCSGDLACNAGLCQATVSSGLDVSDDAARSCELVLVEDQTEILGVEFAAGVAGTFIREAPRTAITFHRTEDQPFEPGSATVRYTMSGAASLLLRRARCFDANGDALAGEPLRLEL